MSDPLDFLDSRSFGTFMGELRAIGVTLENFWIAKEYDGLPITTSYKLVRRTGIFSTKDILLSEQDGTLSDVRSYIKNFPPTSDWNLSIAQEKEVIMKGMYGLAHINKFIGTSPVKDKVKKIINKYKGPKATYDFIIEESSEVIIGFFPWSDPREIQGYAELINAGANFPITVDQLKAVQNGLLKWLEEKPKNT